MTPARVVHVAADAPLAEATDRAFEELGGETPAAVLVFAPSFRPSAELVPHVVRGVGRCASLATLVLSHPSRAMAFVASSVALHLPALEVHAARPPSLAAAPSPGRTLALYMLVDEDPDLFVRRAFAALRERAARRAVLVFAPSAPVDAILAEEIAKELALSPGLRGVALVHEAASLDVSAAAIALRHPRVRVVATRDREIADTALRDS